MNVVEKILRSLIFVLLGVIVYYSLKCIMSRIKLKENLVQYCEPFFTAPGTEVTLGPLGVSKYLTIDTNSSINNVVLGSTSSNWEFERIIEEKSVRESKSGSYHDFSKPDRCSMYIKTKYKYKLKKGDDDVDEASQLYYYLTLNGKKNFEPGLGNNYVSASLFGNGAKQVWYTIDISSLSADGIYSDAVSIAKGLDSDNTKFVFIVTNPIAFNENKENSKTRFLTADLKKTDKYSSGSVTISTKPTEYSIWQVNYEKKGKVKPLPDYKPTLAVDEYPNKKNDKHATFMNTFLPIWNRTWYSSDDNNNLKSFTIKLCSPWYTINEKGEYSVKDTVATGTVVFGNKYTDGLANATYDIKSQGSDVLIGFNSKDGSHIILKMVPRDDIPVDGKTLPAGIPVLQGWVIKKDESRISLCAAKEKNFAGVCLSLNKPDGFQKYLLKKDFLPLNQNTNFSLPKENFENWSNIVNNSSPASVGNLSRCFNR